MNFPVATVVAKVEAFRDLRPRLFGAILMTAGVLLIWSAFWDGPRQEDRSRSR